MIASRVHIFPCHPQLFVARMQHLRGTVHCTLLKVDVPANRKGGENIKLHTVFIIKINDVA